MTQCVDSCYVSFKYVIVGNAFIAFEYFFASWMLKCPFHFDNVLLCTLRTYQTSEFVGISIAVIF